MTGSTPPKPAWHIIAFVPAGSASGSVGSSARKMTSTRRVCVSQPPTTGEGQVQFVTLPLGASSVDEPVEAVVDGQIRVDQALERVRAGGERLRVGRVDGRPPLRVAACEVERDAVGRDLDPRAQPHRLVRVAVGVDQALGLVHAGRQRRDLGAGAPLRVVEQLLHRGHDRRVAVPGDERLEPPRARRVRGDLGAEVSRRLVLGADLRQDQPEDVVDDPPRLDDLDRRDDHALLEDLAEGADRGRRAAADVDVVGEVRDVAEQLALGEDGRDRG